ncbi:MAG: ATP-grasp domain-containing protein, partial [Bacteroidota bacterium]
CVHAYVKIPSPKFFPNQYVDELKEIHKRYGLDFCLPTCEEVFYISKFSPQLPFPVWVDQIELMDRLHNKWSFSQWKESPFSFPATQLMSDFKDRENCEEYVFKPIYSRFGEQTLIGLSERMILKKVNQEEDWIVQEKVEGEEFCVYSLWKKGKLLAFSIYKLAYRHKGGAALLFDPVWKDELYASVKEFGESLGFTGQLSFDIIQANEKSYVIECNPRSTSGLHLLAEGMASALVEEQPIILGKQVQARSLKTAMLFSNPSYLFKKEVGKSKDVVFSIIDLKPFFFQILGLLEFLTRSLKYRISFTSSMTHDISYDGCEE